LNLYAHFPFCRRKCTYCALHSRAGSSEAMRADYVNKLASDLSSLDLAPGSLTTVYFGGGSPAMCDLTPLAPVLRPLMCGTCEFTVELHPLDVSDERMDALASIGVNRISMGVQSLDNPTLAHMGRGYTAEAAEKAFATIRRHFDNAGIDLIIGYPGDGCDMSGIKGLYSWGLKHCSVYSLILEDKSILSRRAADITFPSDDEVLDKIGEVADFLASIGLRRYEISNYAAPGFECRHNMSVWLGDDYIGIGEGAHGRLGPIRTVDGRATETLTPGEDERERRLFSLRTADGLDTSGHPEWAATLDDFANKGLVAKDRTRYRLTRRGTEVCDSILLELL